MAIPVYFATNRNLILSPVPNNFGTDFSSDGSVSFGRATLTSVADESELGNSNLNIDKLSTQTFLQEIQDAIVGDPHDHMLIYLHGFDYRFREAVMRAASLGEWYRSGTPSVGSTILAYSWPSQGCLNTDAYKIDYRNAGNSGGSFRIFLNALLPILKRYKNMRGTRRVTLMAHSLGNHFLRAGVQAAVGTAPGQIPPQELAELFDQVVLAASDEDVDALSRPDGFAPLLSMTKRVSLYYNNQDIPLNLISRPINGIARLGVNGPPDKMSFDKKSIVFVNCSAANRDLGDGKRQDPEWHQYYRLVPEVRDDICGAFLGVKDDSVPNRVFRSENNYYRINLAGA